MTKVSVSILDCDFENLDFEIDRINKSISDYIHLDIMPNSSLIGSCEVTINYALKRLSVLEGKNKKAFENEFKEWLEAIESDSKNYYILFINKIS